MSVAGGCDFEAIGGHGPNGGGLLGQIINGSQQRQQAASVSSSELALLRQQQEIELLKMQLQMQMQQQPGYGYQTVNCLALNHVLMGMQTMKAAALLAVVAEFKPPLLAGRGLALGCLQSDPLL